MSYQLLAIAVLVDWLDVQRTLREVPLGTKEADLLRQESRHLRDEYQRLVEAAVMFNMAVPPPFPGSGDATNA